jgi:hypothetical protein
VKPYLFEPGALAVLPRAGFAFGAAAGALGNGPGNVVDAWLISISELDTAAMYRPLS